MFEHKDILEQLNNNIPLSDKLRHIHDVLKERCDFIDRIAIAIYDASTDILKTFIDSSGIDQPLVHYQAKLSEAKSLQEVKNHGMPRIVNDLADFSAGEHKHTKRIAEQGYQSSYTIPMFMNGEFFGFTFFNSYAKNPFQSEHLYHLDVFSHLISLTIFNELSAIKTLSSTLHAAKHITGFRDMETGTHLERMSHFSRLIAREIAEKHNFSDEYIEQIFLFSPLHDIGKIGIPDIILQKPDKLTDDEYQTMKGHAEKGKQIINTIMQDLGLASLQNIDVLRNIVTHHHESMDGSGYPGGLQGTEIPIEARIIAVADIFDALTSKRPYKEIWTNNDAFAMLQRLSGKKLDKDCVDALINNRDAVEDIQKHFMDKL